MIIFEKILFTKCGAHYRNTHWMENLFIRFWMVSAPLAILLSFYNDQIRSFDWLMTSVPGRICSCMRLGLWFFLQLQIRQQFRWNGSTQRSNNLFCTMHFAILSEFLDNATIHGLGHISRSRSAFGKALWTIIVVACFAGAITMILNSYKEWQESPISTTISTHPITELEFPAVLFVLPGSQTLLWTLC